MKTAVTLKEFNDLVREIIDNYMPSEYWVEAEIFNISVQRTSGHCYLELVQKDPGTQKIVAQAKANIWNFTYMKICSKFERVTGNRLAAGMKILFCAKASFHQVYGYSLNITDIDPTYTLGDRERRRKEILDRLTAEGIIDLNKTLQFPDVPGRIAVISSETAAGYGDFCNQLQNNIYGFKFEIGLFQSAMQGDATENGVISALDSIYAQLEKWDVVVIIRGGGATSDLDCFDSYPIAANIANFPLPVIVGIGHERDVTILDYVAHTRVKTPTAAAELIIQHMLDALMELNGLEERLVSNVTDMLDKESTRLKLIIQRLPSLYAVMKERQTAKLNNMTDRMSNGLRRDCTERAHSLENYSIRLGNSASVLITQAKYKLELIEERIESANPKRILSKGYSLTLKDGHAVTGAKMLKDGDIITTRFADGTVSSVIKNK